jgi:hypothetical protein
MSGLPQDFLRFLFHATSMTHGALPQACFDFVFEVSDYELGHSNLANLTMLDITMSLLSEQPHFFGDKARYPISRR